MTTERIHRRVCVAVLGAASWLAWPCAAELVYYLPFDNGSTATLTNYGSAGGSAIAVTVYSKTPTASTNIYPALGGSHSEDFPMGGSSGGRLDLPDGTNQFRMATTGQQLTFSGWLNWKGPDTHADTRQGILSTLPGAQNTGWAFCVREDGRLQVSIGGSPGHRFSTNLVVTVASNGWSWTHIALAYTAGGDPGFYINGTNVGLNQPYYGAKATTNSETLRIGNVDGTYLPINGKLDDVAIFDMLLSAGKIRALYTAPAVVPGFNARVISQLFTLHDAATGMTTITLGGKQKTWRYATGFTGHAAGDTWTDGTGAVYIQLDAANTGVKYVPSGTAMCLY